MKKVILSMLVALIALPAAASEIGGGHAHWTGQKRQADNKLECQFVHPKYDTKSDNAPLEYFWKTSLDNGQSPFCPVDLTYEWGWHLGGGQSSHQLDALRTSEQWEHYKDFYSAEKELRDHFKGNTVQLYDTQGTLIAVDREALVAYMTQIRLGVSGTYEQFLDSSFGPHGYKINFGPVEPENAQYDEADYYSYLATTRMYNLPTPI